MTMTLLLNWLILLSKAPMQSKITDTDQKNLRIQSRMR